MELKKNRIIIIFILTILFLILLGVVVFGKNEKIKLNKILSITKENTVNGNIVEDLPEISEDTKVGQIVKVPNEWVTEIPKYDEDGLKIVDTTKVATVYAVSVGDSQSVPVPFGFYYVGGNLDTGVIISDKEEDKYDGKTDKTTWEYTTSLVGNQFVWIPCNERNYKKTDFGKQNANWDTGTPASEMVQIKKYGGFYIARYEAGIDETFVEHTSAQASSSTYYKKDGIPQSKAGIIPWTFIHYTQAKKNAESMYNNNYVSSGLVTGTQWDVTLNKIVEKTDLTMDDIKNPVKWGNYGNNSISYKGRVAKSYVSNNVRYIAVYNEVKEGKTSIYTGSDGDYLTTGASSQTEVYHIFDMAGNAWEFTEDTSKNTTNGLSRILRSGCCVNLYADWPVGVRHGTWVETTSSGDVGFRTVLYIK